MEKPQYYCPIITCFDRDRNIDEAAQRSVYEHVMAGGIKGFIVMGSIGEFFSLSMAQKKQMVDIAADVCRGRAKIFVGCGSTRIDDTVELANYALEKGADAAIIVPPYYFALTPPELERWYDLCAERIGGPVFLYNYPGATGSDITPDVLVKLLRKHKNIVGLKDTVPGFPHTRSLIEAVRPKFPDFCVLQGFDDNFFHNMFSGGNGAISGLTNLYPEIFTTAVAAVEARDFDACERLQKKINKLFTLYGIMDPFHPLMKRAMMLRGLPIQPYCSEPMPVPTEEAVAAVKALMAEVDAMN